jgi:hypothetical protein
MFREVNHGMHFIVEAIDCQFVPECAETANRSSDWDTKTSLDVQAKSLTISAIENAISCACINFR